VTAGSRSPLGGGEKLKRAVERCTPACGSVDGPDPPLYSGWVSLSDLDELIQRAKSVKMTPEQEEAQRRSFAYGNTNIENENITRNTIDEAAEALEGRKG
jgi:hypothetical protein